MKKKICGIVACLLTNILGLHAAAQPSSSQDTGFVAQSTPSRSMPNLQKFATTVLLNNPAQLAQHLAFIHDHPDLKHLPAQSIANALFKYLLYNGIPFPVESNVISGDGSVVNSIAFGSNGILAAGAGRRVKFWNPVTTEFLYEIPANDAVRALALSPDGSRLAIAGYGYNNPNNIELWDLENKVLIANLQGHADLTDAVAFSSEGLLLASGSHDRETRLWLAKDGTPVNILQRPPIEGRQVISLAFNHDDSMLAAAVYTGSTIQLWDPKKGTFLFNLKSTFGPLSVAFRPDGTVLASGGAEGVIQLWDIKAKELLYQVKNHDADGVFSVAFSPDGKLLASGGHDRTVRLADPSSGRLLATLYQGSKVNSIAFSSDGTLLASASSDGAIRIWKLNVPQEFIQHLENISDTKELQFLLRAAQGWLSVSANATSDLTEGKPYHVQKDDLTLYQHLIARFPLLADDRKPFHETPAERVVKAIQVMNEYNDRASRASDAGRSRGSGFYQGDPMLVHLVLKAYDAYHDLQQAYGRTDEQIYQSFFGDFYYNLQVSNALRSRATELNDNYAEGRSNRDKALEISSGSMLSREPFSTIERSPVKLFEIVE